MKHHKHEDSESENFRHEMREEFALEALETCKLYGVRRKFQNRAAGLTYEPVWLWMIPDKEVRKIYSDGAIQEERTSKDFFIPFQRGCGCEACCDDCQPTCDCDPAEHKKVLFPPPGEPSVDSIVHYDGGQWAMTTFTCDSLRAGYTLTTVYHLPRRVEVGEEEN